MKPVRVNAAAKRNRKQMWMLQAGGYFSLLKKHSGFLLRQGYI